MSAASPRRYQVRSLSNGVNRELRKIHPVDQQRIREAIASLSETPRPAGIRQIHANVYRIRVGDYRVLYHVDDENGLITIGRVEHRGEATYRDIRRLF